MTSYVYIIAHCERGLLKAPVKIGRSNNPESRMATLQTGTPYDLDIVAKFAMPDSRFANAIEGAFHTVMKEHCIRGEWYDLTPNDALSAMCENLSYALTRHLGDDPELFELAVRASGLEDAEIALAQVECRGALQ